VDHDRVELLLREAQQPDPDPTSRILNKGATGRSRPHWFSGRLEGGPSSVASSPRPVIEGTRPDASRACSRPDPTPAFPLADPYPVLSLSGYR
jgi:hypothetical protein